MILKNFLNLTTTNNTNNVKVDNITISFNNASQLQVKDNAITISKLASDIDASTKRFNSYSVNGYTVDDNSKPKIKQSLWTNKKISKEMLIKAIIFG